VGIPHTPEHPRRRSPHGDQFSVYVADRFVLPDLSQEDIKAIVEVRHQIDAFVRRYIHQNLSYRFVVLPDGKAAFALEKAIKGGRWSTGNRSSIQENRFSTIDGAHVIPRRRRSILGANPYRMTTSEIDRLPEGALLYQAKRRVGWASPAMLHRRCLHPSDHRLVLCTPCLALADRAWRRNSDRLNRGALPISARARSS